MCSASTSIGGCRGPIVAIQRYQAHASTASEQHSRQMQRQSDSNMHLAVTCAAGLQAKTTKKIVLRMQCSECKGTCMKPIKVRGGAAGGMHCCHM